MNFLVRRLAYSVITLLGVAVAIFLAMRVIPGNPIGLLLGPNATTSQIKHATELLGLNLPIYEQFAIWIRDLFTLNLGRSYVTNQPVAGTLISSLWRSSQLVSLGLLLSVGVGFITGLTSATFSRKKLVDNSLNAFAALLSSVPSFWVALELITIFSVALHLFPAGGVGGIEFMVLPSLVYSIFSLPEVHRTIRASMIDELAKPYCVTARAKGASTYRIVVKHALKNALIPLVTVVGMQVGALLSTAVVIEFIFGWPGLGLLIVNSVLNSDFLVAQDAVLMLATVVIASNTIADVIVLRLNRRVQF